METKYVRQYVRRVFRIASRSRNFPYVRMTKWPHRNAENEQMDGEKQEHTSIKQHMTVSYEIWQYRNLPSE